MYNIYQLPFLRTLSCLLLFFFATNLSAQAPAGFSFQAVARDAANEVMANQNIAVRASLLQSGATGTTVYSERHTVTTTDLGVFDLHIGNGTTISGNINTINWGSDAYFLQIAIDPAGGTNYVVLGASQLLSVPYALYAAESGNSGSGSDNQTIALNGTSLSIENGNSVDLSVIQDGVNDADANPNNEIQFLDLIGDQLSLSSGGGQITLPTAADDQTLFLNGTTLSIENGNSVNLGGLGSTSIWEESGNNIFYNDGNVGVGTNSPAGEIHVRSNSTISTPHVKLEEVGNDFARLELTNSTNNSFWHIAGLPASNQTGARLNLFYSPFGGTGFDRMTLTGDGRLGVNGIPTARLELFQQGQAVGNGLRFEDGTANQVWDITHGFALRFHYGENLRSFINANTGAYSTSSDERLKANVQDLSTTLDKISLLAPKTYHYKSDSTQHATIGFLAQEVL
ncbi:MAG: tail fiber domain-containing protein, partial [Bacteroidota bacterium]